MPKPDAYSPKRRMTMQIIVWLIFGSTLCVAAVASRYRAQALSSPPMIPAKIGAVSFVMPMNWVSELPAADEIGDQLIVHQASEDSIRRLSVVLGERRTTWSMPQLTLLGDGAGRIVKQEPVTIGGVAGTLIVFTRSISEENDLAGMRDTEVIASADLPPSSRFKIKLRRRPAHQKDDLDDDIALVKRVCESVKIDRK